MWGDPECRGHFLARLKLRLDAPPDNQFNRLAELVSTEVTGGFDVTGSPGKLLSVRNGGVLASQNRISMELSDVAPFTEVLTVTGDLSRSPVPPRFSAFMHNSMHPIWVPELSAFLGVVRNPLLQLYMLRAVLLICTHPLAPFLVPQPAARPLYHSPFGCLAALMFNTRLRFALFLPLQGHRHLRQGYDDNGILLPSAPFQYGYSYRHIFFTFDEKTRRIVRFSREFCIAALDGTKARAAPASLSSPPDACEGISFVMGAFRRDDAPASDASISFSYGINDCESALLTVSVARLDALLEFGSK